MITVLPVKDNSKVSFLFETIGIEFTSESAAVEAKEKGKVCGYCLFYMNEKEIVIEKIEPLNDIFLADGILRSALHVAVCNNINRAFYGENAPEELFKKLKFILNEENKELNINKLFESCCGCADKNT